MTDIRALFALAALVVWALLFIWRGVSSSIAPLAAVCATGLWFTLFGCLQLLQLGGWLYYAGAIGALVFLVLQQHRKKKLAIEGFGFWIFLGASLVFLGILWSRAPMFTTWDEFSLWGTAGKLTKLYNELYPTAPIGWAWPVTQTPATISFVYFVQFLGVGFVEWQTYLAIDLILLAVLAACLAPLEKKDWNIAIPVAVIVFLTPFAFVHYSAIQKVSTVYLDSLADVPMGMLFGAVFACYFGSRKTGMKKMIPVWLCLAMLTLTKDIGFTLALVAVVILFTDELFSKKETKQTLKQRLLPSFALLGQGIAVVLLPFFGWSLYLQQVLAVNRFNLGGIHNVSMIELPFLAIREGLSSHPSEQYVYVMQGMVQRFFSWQNRITMFGSGIVVVCLLLGMVGFAALITKKAEHRRRCLLYGLFSSLGFIAYYLFVAVTYIYIFRPEQAFESYERYVYPYYIAWFLGSLVLLSISAKESRWVVEGKAVVLALCIALCFRFWQFVPLHFSVLGFHKDEFSTQREFAAYVDTITARLPEDSHTFIVSSEDDGSRWFKYCFAMLPWQVDYSFGGGDIIQRTRMEDGSTELHELNAKELEKYLRESECTMLYIDTASQRFIDLYSVLFSDELAAYQSGTTDLYTIEVVDDQLIIAPYRE